MIIPNKIEFGDTIGLISPASPSSKEEIYRLERFIKDSGFNIKRGKYLFSKDKYLAGKDQERAEDLMSMFLDEEVNAILCIRGGYGSPRILNLIDYNIIKENPKVFIGYSDITALHIAFNQEAKMATYHGPMGISNMLNGFDEFSKLYLKKIVMDNDRNIILKNSKNFKAITINSGIVKGQITGGNLSLISDLIGTKYEIDTRDKVLLLEEINEEPRKIDRMFNQLKLSGKLDDAKGIILGNFNNCDINKHINSFTLMEIINYYFKDLDKPVIYNLQTGHCKPMIIIPLGVEVELNVDKQEVKILG